MANEIHNLDPTVPNAVYFHADVGAPKEVFVVGDPVIYGDDGETLTAADNEGQVKNETPTFFEEGKFLRSLGRSIVTVSDADPKPVPKKSKKAEAAKKRSEASKKAAATRKRNARKK